MAAEINSFHQSIEEDDIVICEQYLQSNCGIVKLVNTKLETALHIACKSQTERKCTRSILKANPNINARNFWGQTPLHYAAGAKSVETINLLLKMPGINVNATDVNGYNALHSLLRCDMNADDDFKKGIHALVEANIDINSQTVYKHTVLHLAAMLSTQSDPDKDILCHIIQNFKSIDKTIKNKMGENFLHTCMPTIPPDVLLNLLEVLLKLDKGLPKRLLNDKNKCGKSPFFEMVTEYKVNLLTAEYIEKIIHRFGASVDVTDNHGNTIIHHLAKRGDQPHEQQIIRILLQNGESFDVQNIYGETAISRISLQTREKFNSYFHKKVNFQIRDRWGRTPLFGIVNRDPYWFFLRKLIRKNEITDTDLTTSDVYGTTILHLAVYNNLRDLESKEWDFTLLDVEAIKSLFYVKDQENDIPADVALRHENFETYKSVVKKMGIQVLYSRVDPYQAPVRVSLTALIQKPVIQDVIENFPQNMHTFSSDILKRKHWTSDDSSKSEELEITSSVQSLISNVCDKVKVYDPRFKLTVFQTGSVAEGTKIGRPDEFDFALLIDKLSEACDIETVTCQDTKQYAMIKLKDGSSLNDFIPFCNENRYVLTLPLLMYLFRYIKQALFESDIWKSGNLIFQDDFRVLSYKPVLNFTVFWVGSKFKHLNISIDLVPVVYKKGWWPGSNRLESKKLVNAEVRGTGCFVLLQSRAYNFLYRWRIHMNDNISDTCNISSDTKSKSDKNDPRHLIVSVAPSEIAIIRSLPSVYVKAYALAKIVKDKSVCPGISIDVMDDIVKLKLSDRPSIVIPHDEIKSYWLKNSLLYVAERELSKRDTSELEPLDITRRVYEHLHDCILSCTIHPYLLPGTDSLELEKKQPKYLFDVKTILLQRKVCIDGVLRLLGKPLPESNIAWVESCIELFTVQEKPRLQTELAIIEYK